MAKNSFTYNLDELLTTTLVKYREQGKFYDNIFKLNPTFWYLHEKGRKSNEEMDGDRYLCNLQYGKNSTFGSYSRYDTLDTTPQDNQTAAYYAWRQFGGTVTIDGFSSAMNSGKSKLQSLLKTKIREAEMTAGEDLNEQLWTITPGAKDILGIPNIVYKSPNSSDTDPGGIAGDGTGNSWWQNRYKMDVDIDTFAELRYWMRKVYQDCTKGAAKRNQKGDFIGSAPDLTMMSPGVYLAYESDLDSKSRYVNAWAEKAISYGFEAVKFKQSVVMWDEMVADPYTGTDYPTTRTEGAMYFLNSDFLHYVVDSNTDLAIGKFIEPVNQDARSAKVLHYHCLACSNRQKQGVLGYINTAITS